MADNFPKHRFFKVENVIEEVLKQNDLQEVLYYSKILNHWEVIVGKPLSKKAVPLKLAKKILHVGVADSAYSHHLRFYESSILELIASPEICGEGAVRKIVFKTTRKRTETQPVQKSEAAPKKGKTLSEQEKARVDETASRIGDKRLQKVFSRYMGKIVTK